jgi:hypothetical protein
MNMYSYPSQQIEKAISLLDKIQYVGINSAKSVSEIFLILLSPVKPTAEKEEAAQQKPKVE